MIRLFPNASILRESPTEESFPRTNKYQTATVKRGIHQNHNLPVLVCSAGDRSKSKNWLTSVFVCSSRVIGNRFLEARVYKYKRHMLERGGNFSLVYNSSLLEETGGPRGESGGRECE